MDFLNNRIFDCRISFRHRGVRDGSQATARVRHRGRNGQRHPCVGPVESRAAGRVAPAAPARRGHGDGAVRPQPPRMQLTPSGRTMLEYARRILNEVARAKAEIQPTDGPVAGIVSIGLLASTPDLLATRLAGEVARRYPHIRLRLTIGYAGTCRTGSKRGRRCGAAVRAEGDARAARQGVDRREPGPSRRRRPGCRTSGRCRSNGSRASRSSCLPRRRACALRSSTRWPRRA